MSENLSSACLHLACLVSDCSHDLLEEVKLNYRPIDDIGALGHCPERIGEAHLNRSHNPTSSRSLAANPSLEGCDPPLIGKPTLPSLELFTVKGTPSKMTQTPDYDLHGDSDQNARPLAVSGWVPSETFASSMMSSL